jgi:hypothetical protein
LKFKLIALTLIAFASWLVPLKTLAEETSPRVKTVGVKEIKVYPQLKVVYDRLVIKKPDEPIHKASTISTKELDRQVHARSTPVRPSGIQNTGAYSGRHYSKEEVIQLIKDYSAQYGISPELPLRIAACESGYDQFSRNRNSTASGVFQFLNSTWANQPAGKRGVSVFDADANVQAAVWLLAHGKTSMWICK